MQPQSSAHLTTLARRTATGAVLVALLAGASLSACKVTEADVDTWKGTVKGPGKMVAVMMADKYGIPLRTHAALALVQMERRDVDGVAELQAALQKLPGDVRGKLIDGMVPGLIEQMNQAPPEPDPDVSASPSQIRAKDAAFLLVPMANAQTRKTLTDAVVDWYVHDFNGRNLSGNFSAEQVVRALGAPAATRLVEALNAKLPQQALTKLAELIGQLGRPETKQKAGQKLVAIEAEMRGAEFAKWLHKQIADQLAASGAKKVDEAKVAKMAELNRANFIESGAIPAMKHLADQPAVANRLIAIASDKNPALTTRRTRALQALEGKARLAHLDQLLSLALDPENPVPVRDYAFDRVGDVRSPKAIEPMWPLVQSKEDGRLRWRAGELILAIGGKGILSEFLAKLPGGAGIEYEPEELEGYATRMGQMTPLPTEIAKAQLASPDWWDQVLALKFFERKGTLSDVPAMERLTKSATAVKGKHWGKTKTVGKVAQEAIAGLRERLKQASGGSAKGEAS